MSPATRPRDLPPTLGHDPRRGWRRVRRLRRPRRLGRGLPLRRGRHATAAPSAGCPSPSAPTAAGSASSPASARASATACAPTDRGAPPRACATTRPSCCSTPTPAPSRARCRGRPTVFAHRVDDRLKGDDLVRSALDSAASVPRCVVVDEGFDWGDDAPPHTPLADTVVYEAHVRSLTMQHPEVPEHLRGTYAGLCHPSVIAHLKALGATAVELLPVQAFASEPEVVQRGLTNYWGYNTLGFFAPHAPYASTTDPQGALDEFKGMVRLLHAEGIEVHPRRRLQPHRRAVRAHRRLAVLARAGQPGLLPARRARPGHRRHRLRQHPRPAPRDGLQDGARLAALLGERVPRRRLPVRPRGGARPRPERRLRPQPPVPRRAAHRPGAVPGQAHRRAVGRRHPRLAHRPVPAAVHRVERPLPRLGAHLLARRPQGPGRRSPPGPRRARAGHPAGRVAGPVRRRATAARSRR